MEVAISVDSLPICFRDGLVTKLKIGTTEKILWHSAEKLR